MSRRSFEEQTRARLQHGPHLGAPIERRRRRQRECFGGWRPSRPTPRPTPMRAPSSALSSFETPRFRDWIPDDAPRNAALGGPSRVSVFGKDASFFAKRFSEIRGTVSSFEAMNKRFCSRGVRARHEDGLPRIRKPEDRAAWFVFRRRRRGVFRRFRFRHSHGFSSRSSAATAAKASSAS